MSDVQVIRALELPWRTGRKVGRTIYAVVGTDASDDDVLIGVMDSPRLADAAVGAHNREWHDRTVRGIK